MVAGMPRMRAASAMACAWLPEEKATTPAPRWRSSNFASALKAPRNLKAPMRCRFSHLKKSCAPSSSSAVRERSTGVRWAWPSMRRAAAATSSYVGSFRVSGMEMFPVSWTNCSCLDEPSKRIEPAVGPLVERLQALDEFGARFGEHIAQLGQFDDVQRAQLLQPVVQHRGRHLARIRLQ